MALIPMGLWGCILDLSSSGSLLILPAWRELLLEGHFCGFIIKSTPPVHPTFLQAPNSLLA